MNGTLLAALLKAGLLLGQPWLDYSGVELRVAAGEFDCGGVPAWGCFTVERTEDAGRVTYRGVMTVALDGPYRAALRHESIHAVRWLSGDPAWDRHDEMTARATRGDR